VGPLALEPVFGEPGKGELGAGGGDLGAEGAPDCESLLEQSGLGWHRAKSLPLQ